MPSVDGRVGSPPDRERTEGGLRERKRAKLRHEIQVRALALFREQGFDRTTMEQIAEAALISPSTLYRYFPTKVDLVLRDDLDPLLEAALAAQPAAVGAVEAIVGAFRAVVAQLSRDEMEEVRERAELFWTVPELRARAVDQLMDAMDQLARMASDRTGRSVNDPEIRSFSGAIVGAAMAALMDAARDPAIDVLERVSTYLELVAAALRP